MYHQNVPAIGDGHPHGPADQLAQRRKRERPQFNCDLSAETSQYIREEAIALGKTNGEVITAMAGLYDMRGSLVPLTARLQKQLSYRQLTAAQVQDLQSLGALVTELLDQQGK